MNQSWFQFSSILWSALSIYFPSCLTEYNTKKLTIALNDGGLAFSYKSNVWRTTNFQKWSLLNKSHLVFKVQTEFWVWESIIDQSVIQQTICLHFLKILIIEHCFTSPYSTVYVQAILPKLMRKMKDENFI